MSYKKLMLGAVMAGVLSVSTIGINKANADGHQMIDRIHFIIPGGAGGGWDGTARGTGEALTESGLIGSATYENMSGGGGGKAIGYMLENAESLHDTLMVNSTPIVIRSLTGVFPQSFRDLTMVAGTIGDYAAFVVKADSDIQTFADLVDIYNENPSELAVAGGSVPGGLDHLVAALAFEAAGADPILVNYIPFDAGGEAIASILSGETDMLSTGLGEAIELERAGELRILAITADARTPDAPHIPTLKEQGYDMSFVNWRGFFASPTISEEERAAYIEVLGKMYDTEAWETVRSRNGWVEIYNPGDDFTAFLEAQEKVIGDLMKKLGFL